MASLSLLANDYLALAKEAGRRHSEVKEAAEKAHTLIKNTPEQALAELRSDPTPTIQPLYQPFFLAATGTKNAKVIALAVSSLQRLIALGQVPPSLVRPILDALEQVIPQGVEIQLKILQTLGSFLTTNVGGQGVRKDEKLVQGEELGQALELSHRLSTSKIPVVASTASATLRQLFMFVFERVGEEDAIVITASASEDPSALASLPPASFILDIPPPEHDAAAPKQSGEEERIPTMTRSTEGLVAPTSIALRPAARDAYLLLEDLCLLVAGSGDPLEGEPSFLRWGVVSRTFGLELVESIISGFGTVVRSHPELLLVLRAHLCPLLIRFLSVPPPSTSTSSNSHQFSFPLTLRLTRVVFLLLKQFSDLLPLESEVFLCMFVRVVGPGEKGEGEGGHPSGTGSSPIWMRVLALEIFRGLCSDFALMTKFYERYDVTKKKSTSGKTGSSVFSDLMMALNRLSTEKHGILGVGTALIYGSSLAPVSVGHSGSSSSSSGGSSVAGGMIDSAVEMGMGLAQVAGSVVGSSVGAVAGSTPAGLGITTASMKLQCIDQLDKAESPPIPETYIYLLALQCLCSLADGFANQAVTTHSLIISTRPRSPATSIDPVTPSSPSALHLSTLDPADPKIVSLLTIRDMAETSWPALLASLSYFIAAALDDDLFVDVVAALQSFTTVCGIVGLDTPREAFLTSLCKFAVPPSVVAHIAALDTSGSTAKSATSVLSAGVDSLGLGLGATTLPVGLSARNYACLKALISVASFLAGSLNAIWFAVFETLQNVDFVIRANATRNKKRLASGTTPPSPLRPALLLGAISAVSSAAHGGGATTTTTTSVVQEVDEVSIQASMAKLFEVSRHLDDDAFKWFVGGLCRLNGEMIGIPMSERGAVLETPMTGGAVTGAGGMPSPAMEGTISPDRSSRRRASGISTIRTLRLGEKSFGISKLGVVSLLNIGRLTMREAEVGWDTVTSHLLLVQHYVVAPPAIRLQAAEVLDQILVIAPRHVDDQSIQRVQHQVLTALASQAEPSARIQSSTDIEIRRIALDTLFKILETNGHSFVAGWQQIFDVLRSSCPSPLALISPGLTYTPPSSDSHLDTIGEESSNDRQSLRLNTGSSYFAAEKSSAKTSVLVRTGFPSLQLIVQDFLSALSVEDLRLCISTLSEFGKQADDVNVALTAGGLLWNVSDHLQVKRAEGDQAEAHGELWMFLLHQALVSCRDGRQEVRDGAISTIFRSISTYGSTLSTTTWHDCMWEIVFPLIESLSTGSELALKEMPLTGNDDLVVQVNGPPIRLIEKQWDDSKSLSIAAMGNLFENFMVTKLCGTVKFNETWIAFVDLLQKNFVEGRPQVGTTAMKALDKVLSVSMEGVDEAIISASWEVAWKAFDAIGHTISLPSSSFTQVNLEAYTRIAIPLYSPNRLTFDLGRLNRLLAILKSVLTFTRSPDFRSDVDALTPLQAKILEVIAGLRFDLPGAASAVLTDLSEYLTLAFVAAFDAEPVKSLVPGRTTPSQRVSYIALSKEVMVLVLPLFQRFKEDISIYEGGAVERMFAAYSLPIKLKHDCPAPSKFGSDELLWKTATINFLRAVKDCVDSLIRFSDSITTDQVEGIWRQIVEGYKGALLADSSMIGPTIAEGQEEESFDLSLLISLEQDIVPSIGSSRVPDELIQRLGKYLQSSSRLYDFEVAGLSAHSRTSQQFVSNGSSIVSYEEEDSKSQRREARFDSDFDRQANETMYGTTAEVSTIGRERFRYWSFELLFLLCSDVDQDHDIERRRIAALCLPSLIGRCKAVIKTYLLDAPLRGKMPFPRIRQEELIFVLQNLLTLTLREGTYSSSTAPIDLTQPLPLLIRSILLRSSLAHLYDLHSLLISLLKLSKLSPSITEAYIPYRRVVNQRDDALKGLPEGFNVGRIGRVEIEGERETDLVKLVLGCLERVGNEIGAG